MVEARIIPCVWYKLNVPKVYNKGTKWETTEDEFLHCYAPSDARAEAIAAELNKAATDRRYFAGRQEEMGD